MMRRALLMVVVVIAHSAAAQQIPKQPAPDAPLPVPVDPSTLLDELARAYRAGPTAEQVEVQVSSPRGSRTEQLACRINPPDEVILDLGVAIAWVKGDTLRVLHKQDHKQYFQASPADSMLEAIAQSLPPLPLPQLELAFGAGPATSLDLTPFSKGVQWQEGELNGAVEPAVGVLRGRAQWGTITAEIDGGSHRLGQLVIDLEDVATKITIRARPLPIDDDRFDLPPIQGRQRVVSLSQLQPRAADVEIGMQLPELSLLSTALDGSLAPTDPPCGVLLFRTWCRSTESALIALRQVGAEVDGFTVAAAVIVEPTDPELQWIWGRAVAWFEPGQPYYSISPGTTIERFGQGADALVVVTASDGLVHDIIVLDEVAPHGPENPCDDNVSPRISVKKFDRDEALIASLKSRVIRALGPLPR